MANRNQTILACIALAACHSFSLPVFAQQIPTSLEAQLEFYNSLSSAEQEAVLRQLPASQRAAALNLLRGQSGGATDQDQQQNADQNLAEFANFFASTIEDAELESATKFDGGDTLVIEFREITEASVPVEVLTADEQALRDAFVERIADDNPYQLDEDGRLQLPGVRPIELAGLDVDQATIRLRAQRELRPFGIRLTKLSLSPVGADALKPFGFDFFRRAAGVNAPTDMIPVPVDYVVAPGDTVVLQLRGDPNVNGEYQLLVNRDGTINLPELGPLNVSGQRFDSVRELINERITSQLIGVSASTTLGELRSISVRVYGEAVRPGTYNLNPLVTMMDVLFRAGGVNDIGSLRRIELNRGDETISLLDLYDVALSGDTSGDLRLQQGDTIFVPTVGARVAVDGEVLRPAIYELNGEQTARQVVDLAGGFSSAASPNEVRLERIVPGRGITVSEISMADGSGDLGLQDGDILRVQANLDLLEAAVRLVGNVERAGLRTWYPGMTLRQLLPSPAFVKPMSDLSYVLIRREPRPNVEIEVLSVDLEAAWDGRPAAVDLALEPRDTVYVFHTETGRAQFIAPILEELQIQADSGEPIPSVRIAGEVRARGEYPLEPGMRISDLLRAGGGLNDSAYATEAELTRYSIIDGETRESQVIPVDLRAILAGDFTADVLLAPYDHLSVSGIAGWRGNEAVRLRGEFLRQGTYTIRRGETLLSVVERAGGLTEFAYAAGSLFTRESLKERERVEKERLADRIEANLASRELSEDGLSETLETGRVLLDQLREVEPTGRQVIRLDEILAGNALDIVLEAGDVLYVPELRQQVTVIGEVQFSTSHTYDPSLSRDDYLDKSGGLTRTADSSRIYVVRANGEVITDRGGRWFRARAGGDVRPGDTVVAPINVDRIRPLQFWGEIAQIVYSMAIAAAAVNSF